MTTMKNIIDRESLILRLNKMDIKVVGTTEDFNGSKGGIWISAEEPQNTHFFDYYAMGRTYDCGVRTSLVELLDKLGWYAEWEDAGTIMLWKS